MKRQILFILFISLLNLNLWAQDGASWWNTEYNTTEGTDFWVTFMCNSGAKVSDESDLKLYVYATAREDATVTITNPNLYASSISFDVKANSQNYALVSNDMAYLDEPDKVVNRGLRVTSTKPISLYITNHHNSGKYDATNVLPTKALSNEYVIQTYYVDQFATELAVVSPTNQYVTLHIIETTIDQDKYNKEGKIEVTKIERKDMTIYMSAGQSYLFRSSSLSTSLSGSYICASKPVAVFMGGQSAKIPFVDPENHIFTQAYPTDKWGQHFIVTPTKNAVYDYVRITAQKDNTIIKRDGKIIATIKKLETYQDTIVSKVEYLSAEDFLDSKVTYTPTLAYYETSYPASCFLYGTGYNVNGPSYGSRLDIEAAIGAPIMTPIIPQELAMKSNIFATFFNATATTKHYVNIVTLTDKKSGMRLDGNDISNTFLPVPSAPQYSYSIMEVTPQSHIIQNVGGTEKNVFTARVYGLGKSSATRESYAYAPGSRINSSIDMLINNQYIKEKTICVNEAPIQFTSLVNAPYESIQWQFDGGYGYSGVSTSSVVRTSRGDSIVKATFSESGDVIVRMIVGRTSPVCSDLIQEEVKAIIHVKDHITFNETLNVCYGDTFFIGDTKYVPSNPEYKAFTTINKTIRSHTVAGCDSITNWSVRIGKSSENPINVSVCQNELPYVYNKKSYTTSGDYLDTLKGFAGCDSIIQLHMTVTPATMDTDSIVWRDVDGTFQWHNKIFTESGVYVDSVKKGDCYDVYTLVLRIGHTTRDTTTQYVCDNGTYRWSQTKQTYSEPGFYYDSYKTPEGCDSVFVLNLLSAPHYDFHDTLTVCRASLPYLWHGKKISQAGIYYDYGTTIHGCDSNYVLVLSIADAFKEEITITRCETDTYEWQDTLISTPGDYTRKYVSKVGCDSIFILHYQHYPTYDKEITFTICSNQTYMFGDTILTTSGTYVKRFQTIHGCDSIVTLHLVVNNAVDTIIYDTICRPELATYRFGNIRITDSGTYYYYGKTIQGCDSVVTLHLIVNDPSEHHVDILTCESQLPYHYGTHGKTAFASGEYRDTLDILNKKGCDSVLVVHLTVVQTIRAVNNVQICDIDTPYNHSEARLVKLQGLTKTGEYSDTIQTIQGCDSIVTVNLQVFPSYQKPVECTSREICDNDTCHFYGQIIYGNKSSLKPMHVEGYAACETYYTLRDTISTVHGCDSVVEHHLMVYPTYFATTDTMVCQDRINKDWKWIDDVGDYHGTYPIDKPGEFVYGDTLSSIHGCDSILGIRLIVNPTYYYYDTATICQNETYFWQDSLCLGDKAPLPADQYYRLPKSHGVYDYVINYTTKGIGCDSAYYLHLTILPAYIEPVEITQREICDNDTCYFHGQIIYGNKSSLKPMHVEGYVACETYYTLRDTISTVHGCDSVVEHHLMVYPTYFATTDTMVCQDRINKDWKWIDDVGDYHGTYPIDKPGEFVYGDTLSSIYGCDSILGIRLIVNPTYYYYDTATICQNETYFWQDSLCLGDKAPLPADQYYRLPKSHGVYDYAINYTTKGIGCDSAYYLHLVIRPAYPTVVDTTRINICDNEMYSFHDASIDTIYNMHGEWKMEDKSIRQYKLLGMDTTLLGCDSAVAHIVTVYPTYLFVDTIKVCLNDTIMWREKKYMRTGVYFDSLQTIYGCDSVYMLNLFVKPVTIIPVDTFTCANEELRHVDTIWYSPSMYTEVNTMVWTPGMPTPQKYTDVIFKAMDGCDSIIYRYYLKINPTYFSKDTPNLCSNDVYVGSNKQTYSFYNEYDVDQLRPYLDTLIIDSLKTQFGCDSVYQLQARIYPAYRHVDYDTICFNEHCYWRERKVSYNTNRLLGFDGFGDFIFRDSFLTTTYPEHACDSIYELRLHVNPSYDYNYPETTICIDELPYIDGQILINRNQIKPNIDSTMWYCDSILEYKTILGCDSIIHLQLLVLDTTAEVIYDTICVDSVYTLYGKTYTQTGFYKDTTINDRGCHNFVYLYLTVIQPTKYWLNIPDICADEDEIEIGYSYEGQPIVDFSVLFDSLGHAQGFEDIDHQPISDYEQQRIYIPIPHKEALPRPNPTYFDSQVGVNDSVYETKFAYPEPNDYHVRVILGNGYCPDDKQTKDTVWKIYYPSWIHEQHWNDGIVLYNEIYNGNYTFSHYQWYWNDEPIIGQVREFLYWPDSLHLNQRGEIPCVNEYKVELTRESDGYTTFTCPICPVQIYDHIVPKMDYFSIVPTLVVKENPVVWILTTKPLSYRIIIGNGNVLCTYQHVIPDANNYAGAITLPVSGEGVICVELRTDDGESRTFKILVK